MASPAETLVPVPPGDRTLFEELAKMTPEERLRWNDRVVATILELRHGFAALHPDDAARAPGGEPD